MPNDSPKSEKSYFNDTTRFLANTLHEIRTPIQTIIGAAELIKETRLDKEQKEYVRQLSADIGKFLYKKMLENKVITTKKN